MTLSAVTLSPAPVAHPSHIFPALPLEYRQQHVDEVKKEITARWQKVKKTRPSFKAYAKKTEAEIISEFEDIQNFRLGLWYRNPQNSPRICQADYRAAQTLLEKGLYRSINNIAFAYNNTDPTYNASTIVINDRHFIALQEPDPKILPLFFRFLINHGVSLLVRLKPEHEYSDEFSVKYWENRLSGDSSTLKIDWLHSGTDFQPVFIPYFFSETWSDDKADDVENLYQLVNRVRTAYGKLENPGPLACHCASGVGRTGTFITAIILADLIDRSKDKGLSVEKVALKLSIQRPNLIANAEQYLMLYRFADYYLERI